MNIEAVCCREKYLQNSATMKCPRYDVTKAHSPQKNSAAAAAADSQVLRLKPPSPLKEPSPVKPSCPPTGATTVVFSLNDVTKPSFNKENSANSGHDRTVDEGFEDSGYLSLHSSQIEEHHGDEEDGGNTQGRTTATSPVRREKPRTPKKSPKCQSGVVSTSVLGAVCTPVEHHRRRLLSSTPSHNSSYPNLPILNFERAVCEELAKGYQQTKTYDWSVVDKLAEEHHLDRVIGGRMGCEFVDVFSSLMCRSMKIILADILALLDDMDLLSCRKVSKTWRRIIDGNAKAFNRCQKAEEKLKGSENSLKSSALTRDVTIPRVVFSSLQRRATTTPLAAASSSSSSSSVNYRVTRQTASCQKTPRHNSQSTRFQDFMQAATGLKQHESLRSCKRCGSPATHSTETQRAKCTRPSCMFDFCTCCMEAFHGSTACRTVQPKSDFLGFKTTPILPGSARSKRNLRRL